MTGLRVVHHGTGTPIGVGPALLRSLVLGVGGSAHLRHRPGHPGLDGRGGPRPPAPRLARPPDPHRRGRRTPRRRGRRHERRRRPAPHRQPHRDAARPRAARRAGADPRAPRALDAPPAAAGRPARPAPTRAQRCPARRAASRAQARPRPQPAPPAAAAARAAWSPRPSSRPRRHRARTAPRPAHARHPTPPRWRVHFDNGESFVIAGLALVGRRPEARTGEQVAHLIPLASADMSVSKTHAQFGPAPDGTIVVMDRGSTNGTVLVRQGVSRQLAPGKPAALRRRRQGRLRRPRDDHHPRGLTRGGATGRMCPCRPSCDLLYDEAPLAAFDEHLAQVERRARARLTRPSCARSTTSPSGCAT